MTTVVAVQARRVWELPRSASGREVLIEIVRLFYVFGLTHPFLDGNGHVQRLGFATCVMHWNEKLTLMPQWTIHPRPYDIEMAQAFEAPENARFSALFEVLRQYVAH